MFHPLIQIKRYSAVLKRSSPVKVSYHAFLDLTVRRSSEDRLRSLVRLDNHLSLNKPDPWLDDEGFQDYP